MWRMNKSNIEIFAKEKETAEQWSMVMLADGVT